MNRDGLIIAGGTIGVIRGAYGSFVGLSGLPDVGYIDRLVPGFGLVFGFEFLLSVAVLVISIWALVRANAPESSSDIKGWGIVIIICGVVDFVATVSVLGASSQSIASGFGSAAALGLIGALLVAGASRLARATTAS